MRTRRRGSGQDVGPVARGGFARLCRRRASAAVAAIVVAAIVVTGAAILIRGDLRETPGPSGPPRQTSTPTLAARQILYSEVHRIEAPPYYANGAFHYGDRVVATDNWNVHMDVTDDGFVYTTDDARLYFSDGTMTRRIATGVCGRYWDVRPMWIGAYEQDSVMSGNAGSLVAWFDCRPGTPGTLVVFETSLGRGVFHRRMSACARRLGNTPSCRLTAVVGEHVYVTEATSNLGEVGPMVVLDVTTGRESPVTPEAYADDLKSQPRELVVGDTPRTGALSDGIGQTFGLTGRRLVPMISSSDPSDASVKRELVTTSAFDAATGRLMALRLPSGYEGDHRFTLFEWLDDDTVALAADDILTCRLSDGHCELAVKGVQGRERLVPQTRLVG